MAAESGQSSYRVSTVDDQEFAAPRQKFEQSHLAHHQARVARDQAGPFDLEFPAAQMATSASLHHRT